MSEQPGDGVIAGRLEIPVESDTTGFSERLKRVVEAAAEKIKAVISVEVDADQLREELETKVTEAAKGITAEIAAKVDADRLREDLEEKASEAGAAVAAVVGVEVNDRGLREQLEAKVQAAAAGVVARVGTEVESVVQEVAATAAEGQAVADANPVEVPVNVDERGILSRLRLLIGRMQGEADAKPVNVFGSRGARGGMRAVMYGAITGLVQPAVAVVGQSVAGIVALVDSLVPAVGTLGAVPTLLASMVGTAIAGKVAFSGFAETLQNYVKAQTQLEEASKSLAVEQAEMSRILGGLPAGQRRMAVELAKYREEGIKTAKDQERVNELLDDMAPAAQDAAEQMARLNGQSKALKDSQKDLERASTTSRIPSRPQRGRCSVCARAGRRFSRRFRSGCSGSSRTTSHRPRSNSSPSRSGTCPSCQGRSARSSTIRSCGPGARCSPTSSTRSPRRPRGTWRTPAKPGSTSAAR